MRKLLLSLIALASIAFGVCSPASAQMGMTGVGTGGFGSGGGGNHLAINTSAQNSFSGTTSGTVTIPTINVGDVVVVDVLTTSTGITSVTSPHLGTFTQRAFIQKVGRYYFVSTSALTNEIITVTVPTANFTVMNAYSVTGANATPWDTGGPVNGGVTPADPSSITTASANTMVLGAFAMNGTASPTNGSSFTSIQAGNYLISEYKLLMSAQTLSVTLGTGAGDLGASTVDALVSQ